MSDNEDLLDDDLGDQSLADYNLGNDEEEQLLADDYDNGNSQNVPSSIVTSYSEGSDMVSNEYQSHPVQYGSQVPPYQVADTECVVPNIVVEQTPSLPEHSTYTPYSEPPVYDSEHRVPTAIPAVQIESPQIVPSEMHAPVPNGDSSGIRERFISERPIGAQRAPQIRDIPDSLDKVVIPRGMGGRGRGGWRGQHYAHRYPHPYRRNNMHRANFTHRASFHSPQIRQNLQQNRPPPEMRLPSQEIRPPPQEMRPPPQEIILPLQEMRSPPREMRPLPQEMRSTLQEMIPPPQEMRPLLQEMRPPLQEMLLPLQKTRPPPQEMRQPPQERGPLSQEMRTSPQEMRPPLHEMRPSHQEMRPPLQEIRPSHQEMRPPLQEVRPSHQEMRPPPQELGPELRLEIQSELPMPPMGPNISPDRRVLPTDVPNIQYRSPIQNRPPFENRPPFRQNFPRFHQPFRPNIDEPRPNFGPNFEPRPMFPFQRPMFNQRPFGPPIREIVPNNVSHMPQVTIRQALPGMPLLGGPNVEEFGPKMEEFVPKVGVNREQEVRMLPVQLPPNLPPGGLSGKKVLINPHFKGNFQPPVDGPIKDIDDAAERFIAEQRNALARAAARKLPRRSPQRYIENTTIEIENELAQGVAVRRRSDEDDLLRRQEEFINANRAGLRRRMRSPSPLPARRSASPLSPRRSPERRARPDPPRAQDEESEYRKQLRHQERLRERVLRAKEVRRRKNAVALHNQLNERERERDKGRQEPPKPDEDKPFEPEKDRDSKPTSTEQDNKPDTTRKSPEKDEKIEKTEKIERDRSPVKNVEDNAEVNSTCENLTPPRETMPTTISKPESPGNLTPPLPEPKVKEERRYSDDDSDLILDDIDSFLSDDDDTGRFKEKSSKLEPPKPVPPVDLRSKLPPKSANSDAEVKRPPRQKIVFDADRDDRKKKDKSPIRKTTVSSSTKADEENVKKPVKVKQETEVSTTKPRQRIIFDKKEKEKVKDETPAKQTFSNRRVVLQRKVTQSSMTTKETSVFSRIKIKTDPTKPNPGIFSRAFRTAVGGEKTRIVVKKTEEEPQIEYGSDSDIDEEKLLSEEFGNIASVINLPHGMTDTRLKTLAGNDVQSLVLDREDRSAKITFKTTVAAESFKKKFNNKMVAASRLTVNLQ